MTNPHSDLTTNGMRIHAAAQFLPQESEPGKRRYVFAYRITMTNVSSETAKLVSRHWVIVDSDGKREEVRGKGVVGDYPKLAAGENYSYVSYCPIATTWGTMEGSYTFERDDGTRFQVGIGRFFLVPSAPPLSLAAQTN